MKVHKIFRGVGKAFLFLLAFLLLLALFTIAPVNRSIDRTEMLEEMQQRIGALPSAEIAHAEYFNVGSAKESLVPSFPVATAGYGKRRGKLYTEIRDSVFVRAMVIDNGARRVAIVSADLLIIPPMVTSILEKELPAIGFSLENTYLAATHSHNSIGNWGERAASFLYGDYNEQVVRFIADQIKTCIQKAVRRQKPSTLRTGVVPVPHAIRNRLIKEGPVDSLLRIVEFEFADSTKQIMLSYAAHATCLSSRDLRISRDYPGALVDSVEASGYSFAMFLAGAVGSHACKVPKGGDDCIGWMATELTQVVTASASSLKPVEQNALNFYRVGLMLNDPQPKLMGNLRLRSWVFRSTFGEYPVFLTALQLGDVLMLGTPCDYSGEFHAQLDQQGAAYDLKPMVTSFNGGYIGYVTPDKYFETNHYETRLMNWYGYGTGAYVTTCLEALIDHAGQNQEHE
jgi:hypothetical protein